MRALLLGSLLTVGFAIQAWAAPIPKEVVQQLLYVSSASGSANIYIVGIDGKDAKNLTDHKSFNAYPAWSPDGKKIAFASDREESTFQIFTMDPDGKNLKQVTKGRSPCRVPSWSPDGKTIAFCRGANGSSEICTIPAEGGEVKVLTDNGNDGWDPAFSPDGKRIAFVSYRDGDGFRLYVMDADGKNQKKLSADANRFGYAYPTWAPNGKKVTWSHHDGRGLNLYIVDEDGTNQKQLTKLDGHTAYASWSPDGKQFAFFHAKPGEKGSIYICDSDGEKPKAIIKDEAPVEGGRIAWRPK